MPTMHIPEDVFEEYVFRAGGYDEAKAEIKETLRENANKS